VPIFLRHVEPNYLLSRTDGAIIVFDTTSESSLLKAQAILESLKQYSSTHPGVILVGNKCDEMSDKVSIILEQGHMISMKYNISYAIISAKNGHNVEEVFTFLGRIIMLNRKEDYNMYTSIKTKNYIYDIMLWIIAFIGGTYFISCIK
jgi:50S ribosomal subunit-associated GTPase HflX